MSELIKQQTDHALAHVSLLYKIMSKSAQPLINFDWHFNHVLSDNCFSVSFHMYRVYKALKLRWNYAVFSVVGSNSIKFSFHFIPHVGPTSPLKHWSQSIVGESVRWKYKIYLMLGTLQLRICWDLLGSGQWWRRISQAVICTHISRTTWLLPESHLAIDRTTSSRKLSVPWLLVDCSSDRRWSCSDDNLLHKK